MTLARDAALAAFVLVLVLAAFALASVPLAPSAFVAGALASVLLEVAASARASAVRAAWASSLVRASALAVAVVLVALAAVVRPERGLSALAGGVVAYLALVGLVAAGVLPRSRAWFEN